MVKHVVAHDGCRALAAAVINQAALDLDFPGGRLEDMRASIAFFRNKRAHAMFVSLCGITEEVLQAGAAPLIARAEKMLSCEHAYELAEAPVQRVGPKPLMVLKCSRCGHYKKALPKRKVVADA